VNVEGDVVEAQVHRCPAFVAGIRSNLGRDQLPVGRVWVTRFVATLAP
jgi:hypothetical protein